MDLFACRCLPVHWVKSPTQKVATRKRHRDQKLQRGQLNDGILLKQCLSTKSRHDPTYQPVGRSSSKDTNPSTHSSNKNPQKKRQAQGIPNHQTFHLDILHELYSIYVYINISPTLDFHSNKGGSLPYYISGTKLLSLIMSVLGHQGLLHGFGH